MTIQNLLEITFKQNASDLHLVAGFPPIIRVDGKLKPMERKESLTKKEVKDLQRKYFGQEGELYKKRQELVKPIQEKVYNAIESIAATSNYSFVFDKAGGMTLLYSNPKYDISDDVLDEVGNVMQTVKRDSRSRDSN